MILDTRTARQVARLASSPARETPSIWSRIWRALVGGGGTAAKLDHSPYKAASDSRSKADWISTSSGPNTTVAASRKVLVARSRDMQRNDPHSARVISIYVNNIVGTGLMAAAKYDEDDAASQRDAEDADRIWKLANEPGVMDNSGELTGEAMQAQECRAWAGDGEVFVRRIFDRTSPIGIRFATYECDMLDESLTTTPIDGGNRIVQGIEVNANGRRVAAWFRASHPGENGMAVAQKSVRVPFEDVYHLKMPGRPGQLRGIPILAPVMSGKKDLGDFESFTLIQKKTEALIVGVVTRQPYSDFNPAPEPLPADPEDPNSVPEVFIPGVVNSDGNLVGTMRPGSFYAIEEGESIVFNNPQIASNYDTFKKTHLQSFGVGTNVSYEQVSGDFSGANYSTMRGGMLEFWRHMDVLQWHHFVPLQNWKWKCVMEAAWLIGELGRPDVEAEWQAPKRQSIEPDKDAIADYLEVRAGWADEDDKIAERGYHPDTLRKKIAQNKKKRDALGIVVDTDPTKYAWRGSFPPAVSKAPLAEEDPNTPEDKP